jgi:hypothetical protein
VFRKNTADLNKELLSLSRKCQIENHNSVFIEKPDYFFPLDLNDDCAIIAVKDKSKNRIVGFALCIKYTGISRGRQIKLIYITDISIDPSSRKSFVLFYLMKAIHKYFEESDSDYCLAITGKHNTAINSAMRARKSNLFSWVNISDMELLHFTPLYEMNVNRAECEISRVQDDDELSLCFDFVNDFYSDYGFYRPLSMKRYLNEGKFLGVRSRNFIIARKSGKIAGALFYINSSAVAEIVVSRYTTVSGLLVGLFAKLRRTFQFLPQLPAPGEALRSLYIRYLACEDMKTFTNLVYYLCNVARSEGYHTTCFNNRIFNHSWDIASPFLLKVRDANHIWLAAKESGPEIPDFTKLYIDTSILF